MTTGAPPSDGAAGLAASVAMALAVLRFNFASPGGDPRRQGALLSAALELAQWGDAHGVAAVSVDEHHVTGHGWSCNPIMVAGMFLARTATMFASVDCALGPLWNPVRLAEDIAWAVKQHDVIEKFNGVSISGVGVGPEAYRKEIDRENQAMAKAGRQADLKAE